MNQLETLKRLVSLQRELTSLATVGQSLAGRLAGLEDDMQPLEDVVAKRRLLFSELAILYHGLVQAWPRWEESLAAMPPEEARQARELADELRRQSDTMLEMDARAVEALKEQKAKIHGMLCSITQGTKMLGAYRSFTPSPLYGMDKVSRTL